MKTADQDSSKPVRPRVCAIFPGALGDFICFLPALQSLTSGARVDLFARSEFAALVPPDVVAHSLERPAIRMLFVDDESLSEEVRRFFDNYAAVYSWLGSGQEHFVRRLQQAAPGRTQIFPFAPRQAQHRTDYYLGCLNESARGDRLPRVETTHEGAEWCENFFALHGISRRPILAIAPGSGAREKNWPEVFFLKIAEWWRDEFGGATVVIVGPVEEERGGIERLLRVCVTARGLTLAQVAALVRRSRVYLGNDSGVSHLAAATGGRAVVLFGPSDPAEWAPRGERVQILSRRIECSPCSEPVRKACSHRACLTAFDPDEVLGILARLPEVITLTRFKPGIRVSL
jgi:ADP-heptose:LPS heptosyltransferase